jgi:hypothetical protein
MVHPIGQLVHLFPTFLFRESLSACARKSSM